MNETNMTDKKRNLIFINLLINCIASSLLSTALTTALPPVIEYFGVSVSTGQWITSGYSLAMGIMMPLTAFLITRVPTRKLYLTSILVFLAGLLVCTFASTFPVMMAGRILQALSGGLLTSMTQVIILTIYPAEKRGTAMGWYGLSVGAAPVLAPSLAGFLIDHMSWRMIFVLTAVVMFAGLIMAAAVFSDVLETKKKDFDITSFALSIFAFGGITLGIGNISSRGITDPLCFAPLAIGIITSLIFIRRQLSLKEPFLELRTLRSRQFSLSVIGSMLLYLVMMGSSVIMPLYVQTIRGYSASISALVVLPGSLAMAIVSPFAGRIYDRVGMKKLFITGAACMLASNLGMAFLPADSPLLLAALYNLIRCISIGCLLMPFVTWGISGIDSSMTAHGTALLTSLRTTAGAIGAALFTGIMTFVGENSSAAYGENAAMHGLNVTFTVMSIVTLLLLLIAVFGVQRKKEQ